MEVGSDGFLAKEFVFEKIPLVNALKYLVAFGDAVLDVNGDKLVCRPVRQALALDESEYDLLHLMKMQRFEAAEKILAQDEIDVQNLKDQDGQNLLHIAARRNQTSIAKRLITLGVNLNAKDSIGYTPIHEAVRFGNQECVELFLKNNADMTIADNNNDTVLETAIYFGFLDIAKMLADKGAAFDIFTASGLGMIDKVRAFLDGGVDYKAEMQSYVRKHVAHGPVIITRSTDPMRKSPGSYFGIYNVTPLHWAARGGSVEVANQLVSRGESVSATDEKGETPLFWAVDEGRLEAAKFLIKHGADVNATNAFASTPLLSAARTTVSPELVRFLIKAGSDVNARDDRGEGALHKLAWFGYPKRNVQTAQLLLDAGADLTARNKDGKTPLDILLANSLRNEDLVKLYRKYVDKTSSGAISRRDRYFS